MCNRRKVKCSLLATKDSKRMVTISVVSPKLVEGKCERFREKIADEPLIVFKFDYSLIIGGILSTNKDELK